MATEGIEILKTSVANERVINQFPQAYSTEATPYQQLNFNPRIRNACSKNQTGNADLRLSKVVVVGDVAVGKTSLVNRFCRNSFDRDYKATIGVDFEVERLSVLGIPYKLQIWDTAGQERFRSISSAYFRGAHVVIAVFDLNDPPTLQTAARWMEDACQSADSPLRFLVGNKKDLVADTRFQLLQQSMLETAKKMDAELWICSAKLGDNVKEFFFRVTTLAFEDTILKTLQSNTIKISAPNIGSDSLKISSNPAEVNSKSKSSSCFSCSN